MVNALNPYLFSVFLLSSIYIFLIPKHIFLVQSLSWVPNLNILISSYYPSPKYLIHTPKLMCLISGFLFRNLNLSFPGFYITVNRSLTQMLGQKSQQVNVDSSTYYSFISYINMFWTWAIFATFLTASLAQTTIIFVLDCCDKSFNFLLILSLTHPLYIINQWSK